MVHIPAFHLDDEDDTKRMDLSYDESPIEFSVHDDITDENDNPQYSVWTNVNERNHVPIYQHSAQQGQTFFSMQREYSDMDAYEQPTDEFWWSLKSYIEYGHDSNQFRKQLWDTLPLHERGFFNAIRQQHVEMNLSAELLMVIEYATKVFKENREDKTLDEYTDSGE